jgi:hypothetical protein
LLFDSQVCLLDHRILQLVIDDVDAACAGPGQRDGKWIRDGWRTETSVFDRGKHVSCAHLNRQ